MKKSKSYKFVRFSAEAITEGSKEFRLRFNPNGEHEIDYRLRVEVDDAEWTHDSIDEFFADYRKSSGSATYSESILRHAQLHLDISAPPFDIATRISVECPHRSDIQAIFNVFEKHVDESRLPEPPLPPTPKPSVFVGHGTNSAWRDLKDHLQDQHGYDVLAYEVGARAGHAIRDILQDLLTQTNFAILVMTGDDEMIDNEFRPRPNVVHELGLFQGRLGYSRAIMLFEEGAQEFSNMQGVHQIRFSKGNIKETFGEVLATLRREFPGHLN